MDGAGIMTTKRRIVVTPAGRRRYLEVLVLHMARERRTFAEWHLWVNTGVTSDIEYCRALAAANPDWIKCVEIPELQHQPVDNLNIHRFFRYARDPGCVYARLDDDVVYLERGFFDKLFEFRERNPEPFLVFANIVNNAVITHLHQRNGRFAYDVLAEYECMGNAWRDAHMAERVHRAFLADAEAGRAGRWHGSFESWACLHYERVSINCISWLGSTFDGFQGEVGRDEEAWLSVEKPRQMRRPNVIFGGAIAVHFSFFTQRDHLDATDLLDRYRALALSMLAEEKN